MPHQLDLQLEYDAIPTGRPDGSYIVTPKAPRPRKREITVEEASRRLGVNRNLIYEFIDAGLLKARRKNPTARGHNSPWLICAKSVEKIRETQ